MWALAHTVSPLHDLEQKHSSISESCRFVQISPHDFVPEDFNPFKLIFVSVLILAVERRAE